jgi:hypothetical protein
LPAIPKGHPPICLLSGGFASRYGTRVFQRQTRRNEVSRKELAESYSPAELSFLILSVYALVLTCDSNWATSP